MVTKITRKVAQTAEPASTFVLENSNLYGLILGD